jgi:hypothetical protein
MSTQNQKHENIEELFGQFLSAQQAGQAAEDIDKAEQMLDENPAPAPDEQLLTDIKVQVTRVLIRQSRIAIVRSIAYKAAATAAVVLMLAALSTRLFEKEVPTINNMEFAPEAVDIIWESDDILADDSELAMLRAEIEQINSDLLRLQLAETDSLEYSETTELESKLLEIEGDFWKG